MLSDRSLSVLFVCLWRWCIVAKQFDGLHATCYGGRPRPRPYCVRWWPSVPQEKVAQQPPIFGPCLLWPNGRPSQQLLSSCTAIIQDNMR